MKTLADIVSGIGQGFEKGVNVSRNLQEGFQSHALHQNQLKDFANRQQLFDMQMSEHEDQNRLVPITEAGLMLSPDSEYARSLLEPYARTFSSDGTNIRKRDLEAMRTYANSEYFFQQAAPGVLADLEKSKALLIKQMNTGSISNIDKSLYQQKINALDMKIDNIKWRSDALLNKDKSALEWKRLELERRKGAQGSLKPDDMLKFQKQIEEMVENDLKAYQDINGRYVKVTIDKKGNRLVEEMTDREVLDTKNRLRNDATMTVSALTGIAPALLRGQNSAGAAAAAGDRVGGSDTSYLYNRTPKQNPWTGLPPAGDPGTSVGMPGSFLQNTSIEANPLTGLPVTPRVQAITPPSKPRTLPPAKQGRGLNTPINDVLYNAHSAYQNRLRAVQGR